MKNLQSVSAGDDDDMGLEEVEFGIPFLVGLHECVHMLEDQTQEQYSSLKPQTVCIQVKTILRGNDLERSNHYS